MVVLMLLLVGGIPFLRVWMLLEAVGALADKLRLKNVGKLSVCRMLLLSDP